MKNAIKELSLHYFNRKTFFLLILLGFWALFQYLQGNELYALFIILFFFVLTIPRAPYFIFILVSVLVIVMFKTPILETLIEIKQINLESYQPLRSSLRNLFTPDSGRDVLPEDVQQMLILIQENDLPNYQLSVSYQKDALIKQRIVESAWPVKNEMSSQYHFYPVDEIKDVLICNELDRTENVALVYCP